MHEHVNACKRRCVPHTVRDVMRPSPLAERRHPGHSILSESACVLCCGRLPVAGLEMLGYWASQA